VEGGQSKQGFSSFLDTDVGKRRGKEGGREESHGQRRSDKVQAGQRQPESVFVARGRVLEHGLHFWELLF
jgi:hypothetical protein